MVIEALGGLWEPSEEPLGKVEKILSEYLWNPGAISRTFWGISGAGLGYPVRMLEES